MGKPEIRFKGYTDEWEQRKLGDVLERRIEQRQQSEEYPRLAFASGQGVIPLSERKTNNREQLTKDEYTKKYLVTELNDIVYNPANVKYGAIDRNKCRRGLISPIYVTFTTNEIPGFIERIVTSHDFQQRALRFEEGTVTKRQSVNPEDLVTLDILVAPKREEQQKIATYFDSLDHLITLQQRKCDEVKSLKKYMLQKMFPQNEQKVPEIRFEGFTEAWEQRKFSDIAARESFVSTSASDIPSVEYEDVVAEEGRLNKDIRLKEAVKSGITFDGSQVLYGKLRPYLHNWLNPDFKGIAVGDWWVLKPINMDKNFLYRLIQTQQFDNIANQSSGSKMPRADWNLISNSEFMVPFSKEEQSKIGRYFDSLDNLITLHQRKPISHLNHPTIHTKHKGEEKYVRIRVNDRGKIDRTANLRRFPVDIPGRFKN